MYLEAATVMAAEVWFFLVFFFFHVDGYNTQGVGFCSTPKNYSIGYGT